MASSVEKYNQLDGQIVEREQLENILAEAKTDEQYFIVQKLESLLATWTEAERFHIKLENLLQEQFPVSLLGCIDECPFTEDDAVGLAGAVKPDDIYQMITDKLLAQYKEASGSGYKKKWKAKNMEGYLIPFNWESKKPYRGINIMLLTDGMSKVMKNPFFLTFKQIEANKAKLKKGSKGLPVVYFTRLYLVEETGKDGKKINFGTYDQKKFNNFIDKNASKLKREADFYKNKYIPIIKYYNVFNGADVEGIDFDLANFKRGYQSAAEITKNDDPRIKLADAIVDNYPKPQPKLIHHKQDKAFYRSNITGSFDEIRMPAIEDFETASDYYRTLLHEFTHSTGVKSRLDREEFHKYAKAEKHRAKEELVAEMGAVFLSAHAGIIWHNNTNHAEYLKNWGRALEHIEKDNRFLMRAASAAQSSTDFILNYNAEGVPAYLSKIEKKENEKPSTEKGFRYAKGGKIVKAGEKKKADKPTALKANGRLKKGFRYVKGGKIVKAGEKKKAKKANPPQIHRKFTKKCQKSTANPPLQKKKEVENNPKADANGQYALLGAKNKGLKGNCSFKVEEIEIPQPETNENQNISVLSPAQTRKPINKSKKVTAIDYIEQRAPEFELGGAAGEFLGKLERKPVHSIIVTVDASAGAGKTTTLFKWLNDFAKAGHQGVFLSLEEHPQSNLFQDKVNEYLEDHTRQNVDTVDEVEDYEDFKSIIQSYDYVFIDSFQKLRELVVNIKIDKDIRKAFNGKVFVIVFQRTKDGKMRGGSDCEFDGDIIIKGVTGETFEENYFIASKNRYTNQDISKVAYNVASNTIFDPTHQPEPENESFAVEVM